MPPRRPSRAGPPLLRVALHVVALVAILCSSDAAARRWLTVALDHLTVATHPAPHGPALRADPAPAPRPFRLAPGPAAGLETTGGDAPEPPRARPLERFAALEPAAPAPAARPAVARAPPGRVAA